MLPIRSQTGNAAAGIPVAGSVPRERLERLGAWGSRERMYRQILAVVDLGTLLASFFAAYAVRDRILGAWYGPLFPLDAYLWVLWIVLPTWLLLMIGYGLYEPAVYATPRRLFVSIAKVHATGALILLSAMYVSRAADVSRLLIQVFLGVSFAALLVERGTLAFALPRISRRREAKLDNVVIVGTHPLAERLWSLVEDQHIWGCKVRGFVSTGDEPARVTPVLGSIADLPTILDRHAIDEVVVAPGDGLAIDLDGVAATCAERGVTFRALIEMTEAPIGRQRIEALGGGLYLLSVETTPPGSLALAAKRVVDIVGSILGLVICGAVALWYAPRLRRESRGPLFFAQERVGRNGRHFTLYKFRTMHPDAEARLTELAAQNEMNGFLFKMRDDPRVVPTGRLLRRTHLDELPQFWNVLRGEMSLVGTRPPTLQEVERYLPHHRRRLSMKPGITGPWQVIGNEGVADFERVVELDCQYIDDWSLWLDVRLLVRTLVKVLRREGW